LNSAKASGDKVPFDTQDDNERYDFVGDAADAHDADESINGSEIVSILAGVVSDS
jgi:hypothetical protein